MAGGFLSIPFFEKWYTKKSPFFMQNLPKFRRFLHVNLAWNCCHSIKIRKRGVFLWSFFGFTVPIRTANKSRLCLRSGAPILLVSLPVRVCGSSPLQTICGHCVGQCCHPVLKPLRLSLRPYRPPGGFCAALGRVRAQRRKSCLPVLAAVASARCQCRFGGGFRSFVPGQ